MLVKDLDGNICNWNINRTRDVKDEDKSHLHLACKALLQQNFPAIPFVEELPIKIKGNKKLILDFFMPLKNLAIEVHGKQHYHFVPHFHKSKSHFLQLRRNDKEKKEWCQINDIQLVTLDYNESMETWYKKLTIL